ncbi:MAG TPA: S9 family peptidase [Acetobacteraceae bacterium]|nr:S9 family peptidase [Acetobacteraceae bacterium]
MPDRLIPRAHLFGNPNRLNGTISPDGTHLAWVAPLDGVMNVWIAPRVTPEQARAVTHDTKRGVRDYYWAYDGQHLLFLQDRDGDENWRLHAVNVHTGETRTLTPEGARATPAGTSRHVRDAVLVTLNQRDPSYPDLFRVELATGEMAVVAENPGFAGFMADDRYMPRLALRSTPDGGMDILRPASDGTWTDWDHIPAEDAFSTAVSHLNADGTTLYMRDSRGRDTAALVAVDLATSARKLLAADARADIGGVLTDRDTYAPLAYHVTVERLSYIALDPRVQPDLDFLAAQDIGDWWIMSRTEDDRLWIVGAHSDTRPGMAYLYDREARDLRLLYETRPELSGAPLSRMHPVTIPARDGLNLVCYLTLPRRVDLAGTGRPDAPGPLVLLVHGGPWARDTFGYNSYAQWLANRGYAVMTVNFRGSTGLGKHVVNAGNLEWGRRMDDDLLDAVAWAVDQRVADPARIAIFGGSYGGYAVLASMTRNPELYCCGVDVVGPSNLETLLATVPPYWASFRAQLIRALGDPDTEDGRALLRERSPLHQAGRIRRPLLIAQGANDPRVKQAESDQMVGAMQANGVPVTYLLYPDEGHGFVRPENQLAFVAVAEQFLADCLGGEAAPVTAEELQETTMQVLEGAALIERFRA